MNDISYIELIIKAKGMEKIRTKINEKWVDENDILWIKVLEGANISLEALKEDVSYNQKLLGEKKELALYDARTVYSITKEASEYLQSDVLNKTRVATAVLTNNLGTRILVNFIASIRKSKSPVKFFSNEEDALNWLHTFKN